MSASRALQKGIKDALEAVPVSAPFYDGPPSTRAYPSIVVIKVGFIPETPYEMKLGMYAVQLHVFGRDQSKLHPTMALVDEVRDALDGATLTLDDPYGAGECAVLNAETFHDPDGITATGAIALAVQVQDTSV